MTAFTPSDIPSSVTTVEQLAVWSINVLQHLYPQTATLSEGRTEQLGIVSAVVGANPSANSATPFVYYHSATVLLGLTSDYVLYGNTWQGTVALGNDVIPSFFKT